MARIYQREEEIACSQKGEGRVEDNKKKKDMERKEKVIVRHEFTCRGLQTYRITHE